MTQAIYAILTDAISWKILNLVYLGFWVLLIQFT